MEVRADLMDAHMYAFKRFAYFARLLLFHLSSILLSIFMSFFSVYIPQVCSARGSRSEGYISKLKTGCTALSCSEPAG